MSLIRVNIYMFQASSIPLPPFPPFFLKINTHKCSGVRHEILHMDSLFNPSIVWIQSLHNDNFIFDLVIFVVLAFSVTTVIDMCCCGQIDFCPRHFEGLYKILCWKLGTDNTDK